MHAPAIMQFPVIPLLIRNKKCPTTQDPLRFWELKQKMKGQWHQSYASSEQQEPN